MPWWTARCNLQESVIVNMSNLNDARFMIRPYQSIDRHAVRIIYGEDEFARPHLLRKNPRMREYLADEASSYYTDYEPESILVAEAKGEVVGALLGAVNTIRYEHIYKRHIRPVFIQRCLSGAYGLPLWLWPVVRTEMASGSIVATRVDLRQYPAHLHIGVVPSWRRQGIGTSLMAGYADYLRQKGVAGYHLYASSFHPLGVTFYRKLGLEDLGQFTWPFHNGFELLAVTDYIFGQRLNKHSDNQ
jgi:GNAT superfamily N-acetyltransferase